MAKENAATPVRRRWPIVLGVIGVVLMLVIGALIAYANVPNVARDLPEAVSAESRERNTLIATALDVGGINDSYVDVTPERAYVSFERPTADREDSEPDEFLQQFVLGAAARGAPSSAEIIVDQTIDGAVRLTWKVETAQVSAFLAGELTEEALMAAIEKTAYP